MSDQLEWINKHFVLLRHKTLGDVCKKEGYKVRPDLQAFFDGKMDAEEVVWDFAGVGRWKCACELLSYMSHRRAAVWWVYNCVLSLYEELKIVPAEETDIDSIAKSFEPVVPDFAKIEPPKPDASRVAELEEHIARMTADYRKARAAVDPEMLKLVEDAMEIAYKEFEKVHGVHPMKLMDMAAKKLAENPHQVDPDSPIFKAAAQLETQLQTVRKETLDTIKSVIPPKVPGHEKKIGDDAMRSVYRWIVSPDEINSKKALDAGNECPDTPAGLLALCAFWAGGNLMPEGEQVVPTPAGLAANGLNQVLLMCALHKGGTRKLKERYEHYFNLGVEVMTGENNWEESVADGSAPHEKESVVSSDRIEKNKDSDKITGSEKDSFTASTVSYKRWKPEIKNETD